MIFKEMKQFHTENRTHVQNRTFEGDVVHIENAANAPMNLKIFGASLQRESKQGKNLFDINSYIVKGSPDFEITDGRITASFDWNNYIQYDISGLDPNKKYTFSCRNVLKSKINIYIHKNGAFTGYEGVAEYVKYTFTPDSSGRIKVEFRNGHIGVFLSYDVCDIQIEEGDATTDYEPFSPDSPSEKYPSEIFPAGNFSLKCAKGDEANVTDIPLVGYAVETTETEKANLVIGDKYYVADYVEYDSARNKATRHRLIDSEKLDFTKPLSEQSGAITGTETTEEITPFEEDYLFYEVKSIQDGCTLYAESYGEKPLPLWIVAEVKTVKGD